MRSWLPSVPSSTANSSAMRFGVVPCCPRYPGARTAHGRPRPPHATALVSPGGESRRLMAASRSGPRRRSRYAWSEAADRDCSAAAQHRGGQDVAVVLVQRCRWLRAGSATSLSCRSGKSWRRAGVREWIGLPRGWVESGAEFVLMPAQPVDDAGSLGHGLVTVVDRQPDLVAGAVQVREGKILH
jgi:hypothetical protein